jgi:hypothetical protein
MFGMEWRVLLLVGGGGLLGIAIMLVFLRSLFRSGGRRKKRADRQVDLREFLNEYPDPPSAMSIHRLLIDGLEARLRLVVMAPTGLEHEPIDAHDVPELLDDFRRGLGSLIQADKPRVCVWPPQLSSSGFAPTFFRLVESPDPAGERSHWIRIAGPIKIAGKSYLLGVACLADHTSKIGTINVTVNEWRDRMAIDR